MLRVSAYLLPALEVLLRVSALEFLYYEALLLPQVLLLLPRLLLPQVLLLRPALRFV